MLITIEGPEAIGKTTQINNLKKKFPNALFTKEPGSCDPVCVEIRKLLLGENKVADDSALMLFLADRAQHMETVIIPALRQGLLVFVDRGYMSTIAYDLAVRDSGSRVARLRKILPMVDFAQKTAPDVTFLMSADQSAAIRVMGARANVDRIESRGAVFHSAVHDIFRQLGEMDSEIAGLINQEMSLQSKKIVRLIPSFSNSEKDVFRDLEVKLSEVL